MKSVGEVMAIGRSFEEALKSLISGVSKQRPLDKSTRLCYVGLDESA